MLPPHGEIEHGLSHIWAELLRLPPEAISANADFFQLGGDSLIAIKQLTKIMSCFQLNLEIQAIFEFPVLSDLAEHIDALKSVFLLDESTESAENEIFEI